MARAIISEESPSTDISDYASKTQLRLSGVSLDSQGTSLDEHHLYASAECQLTFLRKKAGADMASPRISEAVRKNEDQNTDARFATRGCGKYQFRNAGQVPKFEMPPKMYTGT